MLIKEHHYSSVLKIKDKKIKNIICIPSINENVYQLEVKFMIYFNCAKRYFYYKLYIN